MRIPTSRALVALSLIITFSGAYAADGPIDWKEAGGYTELRGCVTVFNPLASWLTCKVKSVCHGSLSFLETRFDNRAKTMGMGH